MENIQQRLSQKRWKCVGLITHDKPLLFIYKRLWCNKSLNGSILRSIPTVAFTTKKRPEGIRWYTYLQWAKQAKYLWCVHFCTFDHLSTFTKLIRRRNTSWTAPRLRMARISAPSAMVSSPSEILRDSYSSGNRKP